MGGGKKLDTYSGETGLKVVYYHIVKEMSNQSSSNLVYASKYLYIRLISSLLIS